MKRQTPRRIPNFDPTAPLQRGTTLLEASAGTGKTYNITNLVMRLVAQYDVRVERILVVTFTRAATAELRERVRQRLTAGIRALERARVESDWAPTPEEDVVLHRFVIEAREQDLISEWRRRLMLAHESFDEAAISTIHGFCQKTLQQSAFESDLDFEAELVEDLQSLLEEIVDDFIAIEVRRRSSEWYRYLRDVARIDRRDLLSLAHTLERNPEIRVLPAEDEREDPVLSWKECMQAFREEWTRSAPEAVKVIIAAARAKKFAKKDYNTNQPKTRRKSIDGCLDTLEQDFVDIRSDIHYFGLSRILNALESGATIDHHPLFVTTQRLIDQSAEALKLLFVEYVRRELPRRKAERNILSFDDLLRRLESSLTESTDEARAALRDRIREDFDAALIDEFQDTDPVQWEIFETVFGADAWLYLVGDPKQAIYGFRGADVYTYLRAKKSAEGSQHTLVVNWRSDQRYVQALNAVLDVEGVFGEEDIEYVPVDAAPRAEADRFRIGNQTPAPLLVRFFPRPLYQSDAEVIPRNWRRLPAYVAADVATLLSQRPEIQDDKTGEWRPVEPRDIAVIVRRNYDARKIQAALLQAGVPAVITGAGSVYESREAEAVQRLLDALISPSSEGLAKAAWTSVLFGVNANELAAMDDTRWEQKLERLHEWSALWRDEGFMRTLRRTFADEEVPRRLLGRPDGERTMTNLLHVAELVHVAETRERLGPSAVAAWLRHKRLDSDSRTEEAELRLESDADAVTLVTIHRSKGLEYPIVFCPTLWDGQLLKTAVKEDRHLRFHSDDAERTLSLDIRLSSSHGPKLANVERAMRERQAENMRLLYVALTRAKHRCVVYWGAFRDHETSPLARVLHHDEDALPADPEEIWSLPPLTDEQMRDQVATLAARHPGLVELEEQGWLERVRWQGDDGDAVELAARSFERERLDRWWRRASYSSLTRNAEQARATEGSPEAEGVDLDLEPTLGPLVEEEAVGNEGVAVPADAVEVPLADFPRGTTAGTFLHECLELFDFTRVDEDGALAESLAERMTAHAIDPKWSEVLEQGFAAVLHTPLGGPLGPTTLGEIPMHDRLDEMEFEFPIAGGYDLVEGRNYVRPRALADVFTNHRKPGPNLSAEYLQSLYDLGFGPPVRGFLAGAIDLIFRREVEGRTRWFVVDHKSNWLGSSDWRRSTVHHYDPASMAHAMEHRHYYLQYHLYVVALHRYLRWRLPDYDYDRDFGGVYYLFLRGMIGSEAPHANGATHGVFHDRPPRALIEALDQLLANPQAVDPLEGGAR